MNRRHLFVLVVLALAGALVLPSMAAPLSEERDRIAETEIVMEPYGGPNGAYAVMFDQDSDGDLELGLDFSDSNPAVEGDGVNAGSLTPVHRVFTITYTGDEAAEVYLTDNSDDVTFYRGTDTGDSLEGKPNAVVLGPDQPLVVGVLIDARDGENVENVDAFTVHANEPETTTSTETTAEEGGGGDGGVGIQRVPESTPVDGGDDTDDTDTPDEGGTGTTDDVDGGNATTTTVAGTDGTTTVTVEPVGTTLTTAETAADPAGDAGQGGSGGFDFAGLPWWLALLALLVALVIGGYGYSELGA